MVVGGSYEVNNVFAFEGDKPPLIYAESNEVALGICRNMSNNEIDIRRNELTKWYLDRITLIKRRISYFANIF